MDVKEEDVLGKEVGRHWYYRAKSRAMLRYVEALSPTFILDIGAGSGFFSKELLRRTTAREALCIDTGYRSDEQQSVAGKPIRFRTHCGAVDADLVLMMDVLEHVNDDVGLLRDYAQKVPNGSHFLVTVPAFEFLWSSHDVFLEHKRRYTLSQVEALVRAAGLRVEVAAYYYGFVFPLAAVVRLLERLRPRDERQPRSQLRRHSFIANHILGGICAGELPFLKRTRLVGLTVFCLASKQ